MIAALELWSHDRTPVSATEGLYPRSSIQRKKLSRTLVDLAGYPLPSWTKRSRRQTGRLAQAVGQFHQHRYRLEQ